MCSSTLVSWLMCASEKLEVNAGVVCDSCGGDMDTLPPEGEGGLLELVSPSVLHQPCFTPQSGSKWATWKERNLSASHILSFNTLIILKNIIFYDFHLQKIMYSNVNNNNNISFISTLLHMSIPSMGLTLYVLSLLPLLT